MLEKIRRRIAAEKLPYEPMPSFEAAEAAAGIGYSDAAILRATNAAEIAPSPSLIGQPDFFGPFYSMLAFAALRKSCPIRVLDFGGAMGDYHDYANTFFGGHMVFDWAVIETDMYVELGREKALYRKFYASLEELPWQPDVSMFSGSLQYIRDWRGVLTNRAVLASDTVFIARTALGSEYLPFLQTVTYGDVTAKYPGAILKEQELIDALNTTHDLHASWSLEGHMKNLGLQKNPAMIWRRRVT
jgi:putative methyltransferase (TIGR04325 family)